MKLAILYTSREGQTASIATQVAQLFEKTNRGESTYQCDCLDLNQLPEGFSLDHYQAVLIGSSIHYGHFAPMFRRFVAQNATTLNTMPSAFFSVSLVARKSGKDTPETNVYTRKFLEKASWTPNLCVTLAGAVKYDMYRWWDRLMVQLIMAMGKGETGRHAHVEYTDWDAVARFVERFRTEVLNEKA